MSFLPDSPPPPLGKSWSDWGERLNRYLMRAKDKLTFKTGSSIAAQDGVLMWDADESQPVVSRGGVFSPLRYGIGSHALFYTTASFQAALPNTAYSINWNNTAYSKNIAIDQANSSRIVFNKSGRYYINFSAELQSTSSNDKTIYIFPSINGVDIAYSTIVHTVKGTGDSVTITRSGLFEVVAGDYLESKYATTDVTLLINGSSATAFSPDAPSAIIIITEVDV